MRSETSCQFRPHSRDKPRRKMILCVVILFSNFCFGSCALSLAQPTIMAVTVGSTVNLSCHLQVVDEMVKRIHLYWFSVDSNGSKNYIYPSKAITSSINKELSIRVSNPNHRTDMSLSVSKMTISHTDTYICHVSAMAGSRTDSIPVTGNGTFLLLHEPLETSVIETDIICRTKVRNASNVSLVWEIEVDALRISDLGWLANSNNTFWMNNTLLNGTSLCEAPKNATFSCLLQYNGETVAKETMELTCAGGAPDMGPTGHREAHQPVLLYSLMLGSSLLILIFIIIIFLRNRWIYRSHADPSPYTNVTNLKRMQCL